MITTLKTQEGKFLALVLLIALFIAVKIVKLPVNSTITAEIMQNKVAITTLDDKKVISNKLRIKIPNVNFAQARELQHKDLGLLGFKTNFFINITTKATVLKEGRYAFKISSDDGFRFKIDNEVVCEHPGNRPFQSNTCIYKLDKREHTFLLTYWQGGGPMGLKATYKLGSKEYLLGDDSSNIEFKAVK